MTLHMTPETPDHLMIDFLLFVNNANMGILQDLYYEWNITIPKERIDRRNHQYHHLQAMRHVDITTRNVWIRDYLGYSPDVSTLPSYNYEALMNMSQQ